MPSRLLIVGHSGESDVGMHFQKAAIELGLDVSFSDLTEANKGPRWLQSLNWRIRDHRPIHLHSFSKKVEARCREFRPGAILVTGTSPPTVHALDQIGRKGIKRINFLTDDPWNKSLGSKWFFSALPQYDFIFSSRKANLSDLQNCCSAKIEYLPFAYAPYIHYPDQLGESSPDIYFAGNADADRASLMGGLIEQGLNLELYGSYWNRFRGTCPANRGRASLETIRKLSASAKVSLALVRRANRDGHAMRSYELPAFRACILAEDTQEHRDLYGKEGDAVLYFDSPVKLVEKTRWLLSHPEERLSLRARCYERVVAQGRNTYKDRLVSILEVIGAF